MKILVVAGYLAPLAPFSAVRCPKFIRHLLDNGHDVRALGADNRKYREIVETGFPAEIAFYAPFRDSRDILHEAVGRNKAHQNKKSDAPETHHSKNQNIKKNVTKNIGFKILNSIFAIPDNYKTWSKTAPKDFLVDAGDWKPDIVYASGPPHSSFIAASTLAAFWDVPWIAEYRDLWTEHPYYRAPFWRRSLEKRLEGRVTAGAAGYVTVTRSWADLLEGRGKPVLLAMNGFDPTEYPAEPPRRDEDGKLTILYAGSLYGGMRDPTPLLAALARLGPDAARIRLVFYSQDDALLAGQAEAYGVSACLDRRDPLPRGNILIEEMAADILLLLRWDDPREDSVIAGKLFEYIGAKRPVLSVGRTSGEAASILRDYALGRVSNDPDEIAALLADCLSRGADAAMGYRPVSVEAFERSAQYRKIERYLGEILGASPGQDAAGGVRSAC